MKEIIGIIVIMTVGILLAAVFVIDRTNTIEGLTQNAKLLTGLIVSTVLNAESS